MPVLLVMKTELELPVGLIPGPGGAVEGGFGTGPFRDKRRIKDGLIEALT